MMKCVGLLFVLLSLSLACAPTATSDSMLIADDVINPAGVDTLGGSVEEESHQEDEPAADDSAAQIWRATATSTEFTPVAASIYSFTEMGTLLQVEFEFTDDPVIAGSFEAVNGIIPVGIDTEVLRRVTVDESSLLTAVERMYQNYGQGELKFLADGEVTLSIELTIRTDAYFSSPSEGLESTLLGTTTHHDNSILTGRLSEDRSTIEWISISSEWSNSANLSGFPPQENDGTQERIFEEGEALPWVLVR